MTRTAAAQISGLLVRQTFSNVAVTVSADTTQLAQTGTLTAPRTVTLPLANSKASGFRIDIVSESGTSSPTNKIILARSGSDLINGLTTLDAITFPNGAVYCICDGVSRWSVFFSDNNAVVPANFASPPAIGSITPNTGAFTSLNILGNVTANVSTSSFSNFSLLGFTNLQPGSHCAFQFGDSANQIANSFGGQMLLRAWHGITIHGAHAGSPVGIPTGNSGSDNALTVIGTGDAAVLNVRTGANVTSAVSINNPSNVTSSIWGRSGGLNIGGTTDPGSGVCRAGVLQPNAYTTGTLPSASANPRGIVYNSTLNKLVMSNGTSWETITST